MTKNSVGISKTDDLEDGGDVPVISTGITTIDFEEVKLGGESQPESATTLHRPPESRPYSKASSNRTTFISMGPFQRYKVDDLTNYAMNDQRWTLQRKKIGLKRKTSANKDRKKRSMQTRDISLNFIRSNFSRKECMKYVRDHYRSKLVKEMVCCCGNSIGKHESYKVPQYTYNLNKQADKRSFIRSILDPQAMNGGGYYHPMPRINEGSPDRTPYARRPPTLVVEGERDSEGTNSEGSDEGEENNPILNILEADGINQDQRRHFGKQKPVDSPVRNPVTRLSPKSKKDSHWDKKNVMKEFPTDAYGMIEFTNENTGSTKPAKYVRLSDTSNMSAVLSLLTDYWRLMEPTRPNLAIAVIGGAKNFRLDGKKRETFNKGLISAVKSTHAWLFTGGMQVGVTKCVGEAVNEGQYIAKVMRKTMFQEEQEHLVGGIKCIGMAPWGYAKDNHLLLNCDPNDFAYVNYKVDDTSEPFKTLSLNGDHTHFLLVDDGIRNKYSGADKFRTELQKLIQEPEPIGLGVPVVLLLLDGGISSLFEVDMTLKNNIPVVVVSNTGRAADLLAYGVSMTVMTKSGAVLKKTHMKQLLARVESTMPELNPKQCSNCVKVIASCCENSKLLTIFDINSREGLDKYILYAVLKGGTKNYESSKVDQLHLALLWNRPDIAECDIFPSSSSWPTDKLEDLMTTALLEEKVEFVRLFLTNGLIMTEYLTVQKLRMLYNETFSTETHFGRILSMCAKGRHIFLIHVHLVLEVLVKKHSVPVYILDTPDKFQEDPTINYYTFEDPYQELMIWAILNKRPTLARFLWEKCNSPLVAAIVATCIYTSLWKSLGAKNTEMREEYTINRDMFEELAVKYLNQCFKHDSNNAMGIVERRNAKWGDLDCLQLAVAAEDLLFISCPCSQASIDISWRRGMMRAPVLGVLIANIFPVLIFTRLFRFQKLGDDGGELTSFQKLIVFYKSPISKFYSHSLVFICFLLLYAYVVLFDFRPIMSMSEMLVVGMIFTTFLEEIHQLLSEDPSRLGAKFTDWWGNVWNRFDVLSFWLSATAFGLRMYTSTFNAGRVLFSVNTNFFYIRLFRIYHAHYKLGPKLVIFYRMISEVVVFLMILLIVILGYGIASQGLLHPRRDFSDTNFTTIVGHVMLTPYWQMYGELLLDEIHGADENYCYDHNETCGWPFEETSGCGNEPICENPKNYSAVVSSMLIFYLIIGNIMLLNLLIAIFTYVFTEVQENSMEIWKYEMYKLIREFDNKPGLVPPFVVFEHIYRVAKLLWKRYCRRAKENLDDYMKETLKSLEIFERQEMLFFLTAIKDRERDTIKSISLTMAARIDKIAKYIEQQEELKEIEEDFEYTIAEGKYSETEEEEVGGKAGMKVLALGDLDAIENHRPSSATTRKVYLEGFSSLPFDMGSPAPSRPGSPIYSRPVTGKKNRLATSRTKVRTQQEQIANLANQMNSLKLFVQDSMELICSKLENLESGTGTPSTASNAKSRLTLASKIGTSSTLDVNEPAKKRFSKSTAVQRPAKKNGEGSSANRVVKKYGNNESGDGLSDYDDLLKY